MLNIFLPLRLPNLPTAEVKTFALSSQAKECIESLKTFGYDVIEISENGAIDPSISSHADIHLYHLGENKILLSGEQMCAGELLKENNWSVSYLQKELAQGYLQETPLNAARVGNHVFLNPKTICTEIIDNANLYGLNIIPVNQGYTKCSVCIINENAIITDDDGICRAAQKNFIDVLLIEKGSVRLKGHEYGFIGGCCGLADKNKLLFNGNLHAHSNANEIINFLNKYNIEAVSINKNELTDIGGIIPLIQKKP